MEEENKKEIERERIKPLRSFYLDMLNLIYPYEKIIKYSVLGFFDFKKMKGGLKNEYK